MVTSEAWHTTLKTKVSGISTDATLFSQREWVSVGTPLPDVRRVCCTCVSARTFMNDIGYFTIRARVDAKWAAKRTRTSGTGSPTSSDSPVPLPRSIRHRRSDDESPAYKAPRAVPRSCQECRLGCFQWLLIF